MLENYSHVLFSRLKPATLSLVLCGVMGRRARKSHFHGVRHSPTEDEEWKKKCQNTWNGYDSSTVECVCFTCLEMKYICAWCMNCRVLRCINYTRLEHDTQFYNNDEGRSFIHFYFFSGFHAARKIQSSLFCVTHSHFIFYLFAMFQPFFSSFSCFVVFVPA